MAMDKAMRVFNIFSDDDAAGVQFQFSSRRCAGLDRTLCLHTRWEAAKKAQSNPGAEPFFFKTLDVRPGPKNLSHALAQRY